MSQKGHGSIRTCIGCRKKRKKNEMIWFKQNSNGAISLNEKKNLIGRGFYLCPDLMCLKKAQKKKKVGGFAIDQIGVEAVSSDTRFSYCMKGLA
jgi:predicted RNA-binding protein YlxR (DUF448 family)